MVSLPSPAALLEAIEDEPHQPECTVTSQSLSSHLGGLCIHADHPSRNLPSIHSILNNTPPPERRLSSSSISSYASGCSTPPLPHYNLSGSQAAHPWINEGQAITPCVVCGDASRGPVNQGSGLCGVCIRSFPKTPQQSSTPRRLRQVTGHIGFPYPTPQNSPVQASARVYKTSPAGRSPQQYIPPKNERTGSRITRPRNKKAQREFCGRRKQSGSLASLQNACLKVNPNMALLAAPRPDAPNGGWRPLKSNNINKDIENPLFVNKVDVMASSTTVILQDTLLFSQVIEKLRHMRDVVRQASGSLRTPELERLMGDLGLHALPDELAEAVSNRGCVGFRFLGDYMHYP